MNDDIGKLRIARQVFWMDFLQLKPGVRKLGLADFQGLGIFRIRGGEAQMHSSFNAPDPEGVVLPGVSIGKFHLLDQGDQERSCPECRSETHKAL